MAPIALSHVDGISDSARARELYKSVAVYSEHCAGS
jgi:hypothetical protein